MSTVVAAVRSVITYAVVGLYVLVAGVIGLAIAVPLKWAGLLYELGHVGVGLALGLAGIRYRVSGREHMPLNRALVFCSNHQSNVDPPVLFRALHHRLHILYKAEMSKLPVLGKVLQVGGFIPVPRDQKEAAIDAINKAAGGPLQVTHRAVLEVTESGTRAAAATAITSDRSMAAKPSFSADRPFAVAIVHRPTGAILFAGYIADPGDDPGPAPAEPKAVR